MTEDAPAPWIDHGLPPEELVKILCHRIDRFRLTVKTALAWYRYIFEEFGAVPMGIWVFEVRELLAAPWPEPGELEADRKVIGHLVLALRQAKEAIRELGLSDLMSPESSIRCAISFGDIVRGIDDALLEVPNVGKEKGEGSEEGEGAEAKGEVEAPAGDNAD
jgi:hypothetical protein